MILLLLVLLFAPQPLIIDFGTSKNTSWSSVNDTVMGGRSSGATYFSEDALQFQGSVSLENNGGFASVRSPYAVVDLSQHRTVMIRYKCKGQSLSFSLQHYKQWYQPNYKVILPATDNEWSTATFQLLDFKEYRVGRVTGKSIAPDVLEHIIRMSIMTNDKRAGAFESEIDYIRFK